MTAKTLYFDSAHFVDRAPDRRARKENLSALAFALFAAAVLSLTLLPPHPQNDPSEVDALEIVAGP